MKLQITDNITTSTGLSVSNSICNLNVNTNFLLSTLKVFFETEFWSSQENRDAGFERILPVIVDGSTITKVASFEVSLTEQEAATFNPVVAYQKAKEYLENTYNWTVNII